MQNNTELISELLSIQSQLISAMAKDDLLLARHRVYALGNIIDEEVRRREDGVACTERTKLSLIVMLIVILVLPFLIGSLIGRLLG